MSRWAVMHFKYEHRFFVVVAVSFVKWEKLHLTVWIALGTFHMCRVMWPQKISMTTAACRAAAAAAETSTDHIWLSQMASHEMQTKLPSPCSALNNIIILEVKNQKEDGCRGRAQRESAIKKKNEEKRNYKQKRKENESAGAQHLAARSALNFSFVRSYTNLCSARPLHICCA